MRTFHKPIQGLTALLALSALSAFPALTEPTTPEYPVKLKVLKIEVRAISNENQVPKDCDLQNYSAYCNDSQNELSRSVMVVEDTTGRDFHLACHTDSRWARCALLKVGDTYSAREEKHGFEVLYVTGKGKEKKRYYQLVTASSTTTTPRPAPAVIQVAPAPDKPRVEPPPPVAAPAVEAPIETGGGAVKVHFSSTPAGAEITIDGKYAGNSPSVIMMRPGVHQVVLTLNGFVQWKRELTISVGSDVNVAPELEKAK